MTDHSPKGWTPEEWQEQMHTEVAVAYRLVEMGHLVDPNDIPHDPQFQEEVDAEYANWLRKVKAAAWAEGFNAGERDVFEHDWEKDEPCIPNPYLQENK